MHRTVPRGMDRNSPTGEATLSYSGAIQAMQNWSLDGRRIFMDTQAYDSIIQFCVDQHAKFDAQAWKRRGNADRKLVALTANYLSMTSWFGYEDQLKRIAGDIDGSLSNSDEFNREMDAIGFDLALFAASVRGAIAVKNTPTASRPAPPSNASGWPLARPWPRRSPSSRASPPREAGGWLSCPVTQSTAPGTIPWCDRGARLPGPRSRRTPQ